jgi:teichuronic acid biosynthesis glycosyltransferase TuaG
MKEREKLVSIISPAFNSESTIAATVDSVLAQTWTDWEMLIGDDGSTDSTVALVQHYDDSRIRLLQNNENLGPAETRNRLMQEACGRYVAFLDTDDSWLPRKLEKQLALLESSGAALACSGYRRCLVDKSIDIIPPSVITYHDLLKTNHIPMLTAIVDRNITGDFHFEIIGHEDYQLWLNLTRNGLECHTVQEILAVYDAAAPDSVSGNKLRAAQWHWAIMSREPIPPMQKFVNFAAYVSRGLMKNL